MCGVCVCARVCVLVSNGHAICSNVHSSVGSFIFKIVSPDDEPERDLNLSQFYI